MLPRKQAERIKHLLIAGQITNKDANLCSDVISSEISPNRSNTRNFQKPETFLGHSKESKLLTSTLKHGKQLNTKPNTFVQLKSANTIQRKSSKRCKQIFKSLDSDLGEKRSYR